MHDLFGPIVKRPTYTVRNAWGELVTKEAVWVGRNGPYSAVFIINGRRGWIVPDGLWSKNT